jgi:hypothetical protein
MKKVTLLILGMLQAQVLFSDAINDNVIWEFNPIAQGGMFNGGGFNPNIAGTSGTDFSTQPYYQYRITDAVCGSTCTTLNTGSALTNMIGNVLYVTGGSRALNGRYVITSVNNGVSLSVDPSTNISKHGGIVQFNIGGALHLNSSTQCDSFFETIGGSNTVWFKAGTIPYTLGQSISVSRTSATAQNMINIWGYNSVRGDNPSFSSAPVINFGANSFTLGQYTNIKNFNFSGTGTAVLTTGLGAQVARVRSRNFSTTANRPAITITGGGVIVRDSDFQSDKGYAVSMSGIGTVMGCYIHNSLIGIAGSSTNDESLIYNNVFHKNRNSSIFIAAQGLNVNVINNTFHGSNFTNKYSTAINCATNIEVSAKIFNNIISSMALGLAGGTTPQMHLENNILFNNFHSLSKVSSNVLVMSNTNTYLDPQYKDVGEYSGSQATVAVKVFITTEGINFNNVTPFIDYLNIHHGGGAGTIGAYLIEQHFSSGTDVAGLIVQGDMGTDNTKNVQWSIGYGKDFSVGTTMKPVSYLDSFNGLIGNTTTYSFMDKGAAQREEQVCIPSSGGGGGTVIQGGAKITGGASIR